MANLVFVRFSFYRKLPAVSNFINLIFVSAIIFFGASSASAQALSTADIRGRITKLNRSDAQTKNLLGSILVERDAGDTDGEYDKADVKITRETRIYLQTDKNKSEPLNIDALKLDSRVAVRFATGPALMIYPIQVGAAEIIILSDAADSTKSSGNSKSSVSAKIESPEMTKTRRAIDAGNATWITAWAKGDAAMVLDTFTSDGMELAAGGKIYKGRKQILELMRELMQKRGGRANLTVTTTDLWLDGNTAYETGIARYEFTVNGEPKTLERRYFTVWKRASKTGVWKIHANTGIARE